MVQFDWRDGERMIHFGRGRLAEAVDLLGGPGYALLTTERAAAQAPHVVDAAQVVHQVGPGRVDELAGALLGVVAAERVAALGGGRVIDTAKSIAAARGGAPAVGAIPTTLSGAEMTSVHRLAAGSPPGTRRVRPRIVVFDPVLAASQPESELAASALNALGHAVEAPLTPRANPVSTLAAHEAARLIAAAFLGVPEAAGSNTPRRIDAEPPEAGPRGVSAAGFAPDRDGLALAALLAGYSIDSASYGLHHVLSQTLARIGGVPHASANAIMLPHTIGALARRFAQQHGRLAAAMGGEPAEIASRICARTGATALRAFGVDEAALGRCADAAGERPDLDNTPPRASRAEILALYESAL